ncbi:16S rRNA (uracil(1498)-N(3))-methyltransferase [Salinispira pacifica]
MNLVLFEAEELERPLPSSDPRAKHVTRVLRMGPGDTFRAGVVGGKLGSATIIDSHREGLLLRFELMQEPSPLFPVTLLIGHPRPIVIRRLLKDLSSMGIERIVFAATDLGERSYQETRLWDDEGWRASLVEGASQARSTLLPEVLRYAGVRTAIEALCSEERPQANRVLLDVGSELPSADRVTYRLPSTIAAVGSERGWSDRERALFRSAGFIAVGAGSRTLRTETACIVGATLLLSGMGLL